MKGANKARARVYSRSKPRRCRGLRHAPMRVLALRIAHQSHRLIMGCSCSTAAPVRNLTATERRQDHLELTADVPRSNLVSYATVSRLEKLTPTVTGIQLRIDSRADGNLDQDFTFRAGQWLDFAIPGQEPVRRPPSQFFFFGGTIGGSERQLQAITTPLKTIADHFCWYRD